MEISELLAEEDVVLDIRAKGKRSALAKVAAHLARRTGLEERAIRDGLLERERAGSTAVGSGVAVPHALLEGLSRPIGALTRLVQPIEFEALDNAPVDLLFTMLWPRADMARFLPTLASVSRFLRNDAAREMLRQAGSPADVLEIVRFDPGVLEAMREGGREDVGQGRAAEIPDRPPETRLFGSASDGSALVGATRRADRRIRADRRL